MEYRGENPIYLLRDSNGEFNNLSLNSEQRCKASKYAEPFTISEFLESGKYYSEADKRTEINTNALKV